MVREGEQLPYVSWKELIGREKREVPFLIDPYIPRESIVFLWGDTSIGKSPLTWAMAKAIGEGTHFFGLPVKQGRCLYVEADTPEVVISPRIQAVKGEVPENVWFAFTGALGVPLLDDKKRIDLLRARDECRPDVVFLNTLRKMHDLKDTDSTAPKAVYSYFQELFPGCALVFVHHIRKTPINPNIQENEREAFSGNKHWLDDAQVGLHLSRWAKKDSKQNLSLHHVKSQVSEVMKPLPLKLHGDGSTLSSPLFDDLLVAYNCMQKSGELDKGQIDQMIADLSKVSVSTARRRRAIIEHGKFPGTRAFLSSAGEDEDGQEA